MAAMSVAMIRFSWVFGIGGLLIGIGTGLASLMKNRKTIFGFIDAAQDIKHQIRSGSTITDADVNTLMRGRLNPIAERVVKARKKQLEKQKPEATGDFRNG
jgi:hypothetical protein